MLIFAEMLVEPAEKAGIRVPPNVEKFDAEMYPHFQVFCTCQLGASMPTPSSHWDNAKVIASIPDDEIKLITFNELVQKGFAVGKPTP